MSTSSPTANERMQTPSASVVPEGPVDRAVPENSADRVVPVERADRTVAPAIACSVVRASTRTVSAPVCGVAADAVGGVGPTDDSTAHPASVVVAHKNATATRFLMLARAAMRGPGRGLAVSA